MSIHPRILPSLALLFAIGIFFAYVRPTWSGSIAATRAAIASDDQALIAAQKYIAQQNQLASARDAIDPKDLEALTTFLPDSVDNVRLILDLNALAARSGISVMNIDVTANSTLGTKNAPVTPLSSVGSIDISLSASGTFMAFQAFLRGVEKSARLLDIRDIVVKGSDTNIYEYQMTLRLYWLR